jgi:hypothetical protein
LKWISLNLVSNGGSSLSTLLHEANTHVFSWVVLWCFELSFDVCVLVLIIFQIPLDSKDLSSLFCSFFQVRQW